MLTYLLIVQFKTFDIVLRLQVWFIKDSTHCLLIKVKLYEPLLVGACVVYPARPFSHYAKVNGTRVQREKGLAQVTFNWIPSA